MSHAPFAEQLAQSQTWLERELNGLRTGRATPTLVENISVACYGSSTPLQQLASIQAPEPQMLVIQPWDPGLIKDIEKAISQSSLGINPIVDGKSIRLPFPPMTQELRDALSKVVKEKSEQAKVNVRTAREEALKVIKHQERDGELSEDAAEAERKSIQQTIDEAIATIEQTAEKKTTELQTL